MGYSYLPDFPQESRARIKAIEIQAGFELEDSKQQLSRLSDFETEVRKYILTIFSAFAEEALALGQRGSWTVEILDREAREFLASITLQAQLEKGYDRRGHSISPLTNHVFGHILPEVRRELEQSSVWRRYQEQLAEVARLQASSSAEEPPKISRETGQAAVSRRGGSGTGAQKKSTHPARAQKSQAQAEVAKVRAETVAKLIEELNVLKPQMLEDEAEYSLLQRRYPGYLTFKIAQDRPDLKMKIMNIRGSVRHFRLAQELAAAHHGLSWETIADAWKKHKPPRYKRLTP